ncbi:MAG: hypothetical protein HC831_25785 [Chloroflexia bacterium]|nr:hypothetical protein [Chloroflexia bacterium]
MPLNKNPYSIDFLEKLKDKIRNIDWVDAGEQFVYEALLADKKLHICSSVGLSSKDYFTDQYLMNAISLEELMNYTNQIIRPQIPIQKAEFDNRYPELKVDSMAKSFNDNGEVIFLHAGRSSKRKRLFKKNRGRFIDFRALLKKNR